MSPSIQRTTGFGEDAEVIEVGGVRPLDELKTSLSDSTNKRQNTVLETPFRSDTCLKRLTIQM